MSPHFYFTSVTRIPFTVVIFYLISPIPTLIAKRRGEDSSGYAPLTNSSVNVREVSPLFPVQVKPLPRACLVLDDWHRRLCFCPPHRSCQSPSSSKCFILIDQQYGDSTLQIPLGLGINLFPIIANSAS